LRPFENLKKIKAKIFSMMEFSRKTQRKIFKEKFINIEKGAKNWIINLKKKG